MGWNEVGLFMAGAAMLFAAVTVSVNFFTLLFMRRVKAQRRLNTEATLEDEAILDAALKRLQDADDRIPVAPSPGHEIEQYKRAVEELRVLLEAEQARRKRIDSILLWLAAAGGIGFTIGFLSTYADDVIKFMRSSGLFIQPAYAATERQDVLAPVIPIMAAMVLGVIIVTFLAAFIALLWLEDNRENKERRRAADMIVKMFGGFLTGMLTMLMR